MTNRELSEKLDTLATRLEGTLENNLHHGIVLGIIQELRALSTEKYTPNTSWDTIKKQTTTIGTKKNSHTDKSGRKMPF